MRRLRDYDVTSDGLLECGPSAQPGLVINRQLARKYTLSLLQYVHIASSGNLAPVVLWQLISLALKMPAQLLRCC